MALYEGELLAQGSRRFAIAASRFNDLICERLLAGCRDTLVRHGVAADRIDLARVPGCFELPLVALRLAASGRYAAVICLGALIRGATPHFDHIAAAATSGIAEAALRTGVPCIFGVLTCDTLEQALERAGGKAGNKGAEAALAALEVADLLARLPDDRHDA
ncbi:MAG: 6,7-dimethyl-8-ribityllumazine synthase [Planctomycetota bacterium]|nr:MAG: 6,7-dimethyl-8-ribityllumazine synthase [Planctomycetota bacterium]